MSGGADASAAGSWEMSTRGHPLSDLTNLLTPYTTASLLPPPSESSSAAPDAALPHAHPAFHPSSHPPGLPTYDEVVALYGEAAGWTVPPGELRWATAFNMFRQACISQGIAARVATRQASSAEARRYAAARNTLAELAWRLVLQVKEGEGATRDRADSKL